MNGTLLSLYLFMYVCVYIEVLYFYVSSLDKHVQSEGLLKWKEIVFWVIFGEWTQKPIFDFPFFDNGLSLILQNVQKNMIELRCICM